MKFEKTYGVPCEHEGCNCEKTYYLNVGKCANWLCEKHMRELIKDLQNEFDKIIKEVNDMKLNKTYCMDNLE